MERMKRSFIIKYDFSKAQSCRGTRLTGFELGCSSVRCEFPLGRDIMRYFLKEILEVAHNLSVTPNSIVVGC